MKTPKLTHERLLELLHYDPETGVFTWRVDRWRGRGMGVLAAAAGSVAGSVNGDGYVCIKIDGENHKAHRLARFYVTGEWPRAMVDHRDLDRSNNRYDNLRNATRGQNRANSTSKNKHGFKGVAKVRGRYMAQIRKDKKNINLGYFDSAAEAGAIYDTAAKGVHGEFARVK
ncbi:HNH endonuclease [Pararhizobium qamdonense]|uniref:HNH endonuclease n=1 Tax=Pararhizobium qamdonense TaxID=3031126 RepID=UPI0023E2F493|nr:HNH endonuclease [Pararhizobium qamdonense]